MKTKLFFLLLLSVVLASQARISIPRPGAISDVAEPKAASMKLPGSSVIPSFNNPAKASKGLAASYGQLPLSFEANHGQTDSQVQFLSRSSGYTLFLTKNEAVFQLRTAGFSNPQFAIRNPQSPMSIDDFRLPILDRRLGATRSAEFANRQSTVSNRQWAAVRMKLIGANPNPEIEGLDRLPGISNYFIGNDPKKWRTNIPNCSRVQYRDVYPGISLVYYGNQRQLEYDLVVAPGADPNVIKLAYEGVDSMDVDMRGDLVLKVGGVEIRQHKPNIYQETDAARKEIGGHFVRMENHRIGCQIDPYDIAKDLVIDPVLSYSTYLGGSEADAGLAIAVDTLGSVYVTGYTTSADFPVTSGSFETSYPGGTCGGIPGGPCEHVFVSKLNSHLLHVPGRYHSRTELKGGRQELWHCHRCSRGRLHHRRH